ncbi:MAG: type I methionyl aminopeptidase [Candidatus Yanofskybacteria bacterium RIFCSPHIGHO2_02_FULL_38_22b]|uniref:Methionine aminopeptidase n=1 Tax=Candidatus Yanofskybacteria bacterium RIFCSPHIGHO2_02_FULL_38_22b TaxID=1802673 RepID=A0A1F8F1U4_9BACT|nr:MAG: type I methionyl aminopeptidase [Candidatus Yanofskybacteria bacterium RIFCSPHIGHO2_01_FULL_39_44]OGN07095.1 MAG: type I methionyl aminopeptidase [Candidatus Yanofskybacteria bacterium RIFCSPHIGHO2_02_FULL_38_22b]OGN19945.1 MAG: type I methionyl aminopeptidase [Candidatus Yanofskybacteria bacterium RIFCSPLOWO2_01_FULL_39_28]
MIQIKTQQEIQTMHEGGRILAQIIKELAKAVKPGVATKDLDKLARELVFKFGAEPAFLNYNGYPAALCTSINDEIVHGVPSSRKLEKGDLLKLDMGVLWKGFYTDSAVTVLVGSGLSLGKNNLLKKKLIRVTKEALDFGIRQAKIGNTIGDIGSIIQKHVEKNGFNVVRDLVGHGIGRGLHEEPQVLNYGKAGEGEKLVEGMVIAVEPMVVTGGWKIKEVPDGFVFQTKDGGLAAHFEHTVAVTEKGPLVLTK